jgi:phage-related protein
MSAILGALIGGTAAGGIASGIGNVIGKIVDAIKEFFMWIARTLLRIARWYFNLLKTKPEWAITIPILLIYFFS